MRWCRCQHPARSHNSRDTSCNDWRYSGEVNEIGIKLTRSCRCTRYVPARRRIWLFMRRDERVEE